MPDLEERKDSEFPLLAIALQKHPSEAFYKTFRKIQRKTPVPESLFY